MKMNSDNNLVRRVEPLSFSMGCLEGCQQSGDSPLSNSIRVSPLTTNSLNRKKSNVRVDRDGVRKSWGPSDKEEGNQEFWASIREPYDFIMSTHLIPDSYEVEAKEEQCSTTVEMELSWDPEDVSPPYVWDFSEFLDQYNELYEWLIQVQLKLYSHSNPPDKHSRMAQQDELRRHAFRRKLFVEQGERVAGKYPSEEEEIKWRVNYLNNKWEQLQSTLTPVKGRLEEVEVELDLAHEEELLCNWLRTMERQIQPITCRLPRGCSLHALQERYKDNQILLKDIEAHGPILKSVIRQYERLAYVESDPTCSKDNAPGSNLSGPSSKPSDPTSKPSDPTSKPSDPSSKPSDPSSKPSDPSFTPSTKPSAPFSKPSVPSSKPSDPSSKPSDPSSKPSDPSFTPSSKPSGPSSAPSSNPSAPTLDSSAADNAPTQPPREKANRKAKGPASAVPRRAKSLEKRWHQIYLRSLEWHYHLEGVIANFKEQDLSCTSSDSEDEPVTKCRRLSTSSFSSAASAHFYRRKPRPQGWSDYDANSSEAGSYIEDDYVYMTDSEVAGCKGSQGRKTSRMPGHCTANAGNSPLTEASMVGVNTVLSSSICMDRKEKLSSAAVLNENEKNGNLPASKAPDNDNNAVRKDSRRAKEASLTEVERPFPNCGVFDYKHHDTDSDNNNGDYDTVLQEEETKVERVTVKVERRYRIRSSTVRRKVDFASDEEAVQEDLQNIIDTAILDQNWLDSNITTDSDDSLIEDEVPCVHQDALQESMDTESEESPLKEPKESVETSPTKISPKPCDKESIHRLISGAEQLVREPLKDPTTISPRSSLKPLPFGVPGEKSKQHRIKQWLSSQCGDVKSSLIGCNNNNNNINLQDSCDASGELTTEDSGEEGDSSDNDLDVSSATQKGSGDLLLSSENTPTLECLPSLALDPVDRVIIRGKKRQQKEQRPFSVSDPQQLTRSSPASGHSPTTPDSFEELKKSAVTRSGLSSSESALNRIQASSDETTKQCSISLSDPMVSNDQRAKSLSPFVASNHTQSPTITSTTLPSQSPTAINTSGRASPSIIPHGSMRRRRTKFRRRSNQFLCRRTDSGSEELIVSKPGRGKDSKGLAYSPYHFSLTKSLSSESESFSGCPRVVKSSSFSGECIGHSGVMTSSTEKCLSDSSMISGTKAPPPSSVPESKEEGAAAAPVTASLRSTNGSPAVSPRRGLASDQEASTHQEDFSSLSEQAWDPYQELKYLSEPYSEDIDQDAARRLLDFGDDYRKYIDSDGSSFLGLPLGRRRSPHHRKVRAYPSYRNLDSDSDLEDLHHVIEESKSQLSAMEGALERFSNQATLGLDFSELLATAKTNLKCLYDIQKHLQMETPDLQSQLGEVQNIVQRWETLQSKAAERQRQSMQLRQLQRQVKSLRLSMEGVLNRCATFAHPHTLDDPSEIGQKVEEVKVLLEETENLRSDLSNLNVMVHRFTSEIGSSFTPLKDEMAELYRLWDETHRRVNSELSSLQSAEATWRLWEEQKAELSQALKQDSDTLKVIDAAIDNGRLTETVTASVHDVAKLLNERRIPNSVKAKNQMLTVELSGPGEKNGKTKIEMEGGRDDRLSDSGTSGYESCSSDDLSERERRLAYLRRLARDLEASLVPGSKAWNEISTTLTEAEKELQGLQDHCRNLVLRTAETFDPSSKQPRFSSNNKRRNWAREAKSCRSPRVERRPRSGGNFRREWIWRVVRAALPFQAALMLLLCVTCLLEPHCCDSVNTLNLNFTPQLRFVHGSPPV